VKIEDSAHHFRANFSMVEPLARMLAGFSSRSL